MRHFLSVCLVLLVMSNASAQESAKPDPRIAREITYCRNRLGADFTVWQVGTYVVASDLPEKERGEYEQLILGQDARLYDGLFATRINYVLKIVLFKDNASLRKSAKKMATKSLVMPGGGFFLPYEKVLCIDTAMGAWVTRHELTHAMLHADFRQDKLTPWIDEGVAMLVESAAFGEKDVTFRMDWRFAMMQQLVKSQQAPHLADVMKMDFRAYNSPKTRMINDVVSRNFLMYLVEKDLFTKFYKRYRADYSRDRTGIRFVEEVLEKKIDEIEKDFLAWVAEKSRGSARPAGADEADVSTK